jgi:hypothetical protein
MVAEKRMCFSNDQNVQKYAWNIVIAFIFKDYDSHWERSERLQLRVCMLNQSSLDLQICASNLVCSISSHWMPICKPDQWENISWVFLCNCWNYSEWLFRASLCHLCATLVIIPQWNREEDFYIIGESNPGLDLSLWWGKIVSLSVLLYTLYICSF